MSNQHHLAGLSAAVLLSFAAQGCFYPQVARREATPLPRTARVRVTPLPPIVDTTPLSEVAKELGMTIKIDMHGGKRTLARGEDRITIIPGEPKAEVNGVTVSLTRPVLWSSGELVGPKDLRLTLKQALERFDPAPPRPAAVTVAASAPRVRPQASAPPIGAPLSMPRGWAVSANRRWTSIIIHHSATHVGGAKSFHRNHAKKWRYGLGYHFVIGNGSETGLGRIEVGPRWRRQNEGIHGAHAGTKVYNQAGIGICLVGNFQGRGPAPAQLAALRLLCRQLMQRYNIPSSKVYMHRAVRPKHTDCPGKNFPWRAFKRSL